MKITETACVGDELCRLLKEEEEEDREFRRSRSSAVSEARRALL